MTFKSYSLIANAWIAIGVQALWLLQIVLPFAFAQGHTLKVQAAYEGASQAGLEERLRPEATGGEERSFWESISSLLKKRPPRLIFIDLDRTSSPDGHGPVDGDVLAEAEALVREVADVAIVLLTDRMPDIVEKRFQRSIPSDLGDRILAAPLNSAQEMGRVIPPEAEAAIDAMIEEAKRRGIRLDQPPHGSGTGKVVYRIEGKMYAIDVDFLREDVQRLYGQEGQDPGVELVSLVRDKLEANGIIDLPVYAGGSNTVSIFPSKWEAIRFWQEKLGIPDGGIAYLDDNGNPFASAYTALVGVAQRGGMAICCGTHPRDYERLPPEVIATKEMAPGPTVTATFLRLVRALHKQGPASGVMEEKTGLEERPKAVPITYQYAVEHAADLAAIDQGESVWEQEGAWGSDRFPMDNRPSTGTPLKDLWGLSFAIEDSRGIPVAYIYTTNGQPDYRVATLYPGAFIFRLSVHPDHQGRRLGHLLLLASARAAQEKRIGPSVTLETAEQNQHARHVYESLGFQKVGMRSDPKKGVTFVEYAVSVEKLIQSAEGVLNQHYGAGVEEGPLEDEGKQLEQLAQRLSDPMVTGGEGIRWRFLTGKGETYDALVQDYFPHALLPELKDGLSPLLARLEREAQDQEKAWSWADCAGGFGAAVKEARLRYPNLRSVLVDAKRWRPKDIKKKEKVDELLQQASERRIQDLWSMEGIRFIERDISTVQIGSPDGAPIRLITVIQALSYNTDPLGILVHLYNQLSDGGYLLANHYIPTEHRKAEELKKFYEQIFKDLRKLGISVDLKVMDFRHEAAPAQGYPAGFNEYHLGMVLVKQPGSLRLQPTPPPSAESFIVKTVRSVEYKVAWYEGDLSKPFIYLSPAGLEEVSLHRFRQVTVGQGRYGVVFAEPEGLAIGLTWKFATRREDGEPLARRFVVMNESQEQTLKDLGVSSEEIVRGWERRFDGNVEEAIAEAEGQLRQKRVVVLPPVRGSSPSFFTLKDEIHRLAALLEAHDYDADLAAEIAEEILRRTLSRSL